MCKGKIKEVLKIKLCKYDLFEIAFKFSKQVSFPVET